jgi:hypothetical protein
MTVTDEQVERAYNRFMQANSETDPCPRCTGNGYHHGFGEHGHDPDWCESCGGPGTVPRFDEMSAMREALDATLGDSVPVPLQAILDLREYLLTEFQMEHYKAKFAAIEAALEAVGKGTE